MSDILKIIKERQSGRVPFDPNRPVAKEDLKADSGGWTLGAYRAQHAELRHHRG